MPTRSVLLLTLFFIFSAGFNPLISSQFPMSGAAWADDDDDGGGGDDDDDNGSERARDDDDDDAGQRMTPRGRQGEGGLFRLFQRPRQTQRTAPPPPAPAPPAPEFAADEIVTIGLSDDDLAVLIAQGFGVIETAAVPSLAATPRRLSTPAGLGLVQARDVVRALPSGQDADFNHYYRSEQGFPDNCQGSDCPARLMIDWTIPVDRDGACGGSVPIGMIDTGINEDHSTFVGAALDVIRLGPDTLDRSRALHGTAVAALLVGDPATRSPGLVPGAKLVAVDAFYRSEGDERADIFTLLQALGYLLEKDVKVINLSLAGPANTVLEETVERLVFDNDIVVVSAVGNSGPGAEPEYPAAYEPVIAVTAVDREGAIYRRAVRGPHVDIAAPGVNVWTAASISGARFKTGTSFAVPFVTAAAAIVREARPNLDAVGVANILRQSVTDLGEPGRDDVFGAGLLNIDGLCDKPL